MTTASEQRHEENRLRKYAARKKRERIDELKRRRDLEIRLLWEQWQLRIRKARAAR